MRTTITNLNSFPYTHSFFSVCPPTCLFLSSAGILFPVVSRESLEPTNSYLSLIQHAASNGLADMRSHLWLLRGHYGSMCFHKFPPLVRILIQAWSPSSCCWGLLALPDGPLRQALQPDQASSVLPVCHIWDMGDMYLSLTSDGLLVFRIFHFGLTSGFS